MPSALAGDGDVVEALGRSTREGRVKERRRFGFEAAGAR
jgi:hypothetical protein